MNALLTSLGALGLVAFAVSALAGAAWMLTERWRKALVPAAESRLLMLVILLPIAVAGASAAAYAEWPGGNPMERLGFWELSERELAERAGHGERGHPEGRGHDDAEHGDAGAEGGHAATTSAFAGQAMLAFLAFMGAALIGRMLLMLGRVLQAVGTSIATSRRLREVANLNADGAWVLPTDAPEAFVLGLLQPRLFVSQGLLRLPDATVAAVMAHERAHMRRFDPLRHLIALLACTFHLPGISKRLRQRAQQSQELAADAMAARSMGDSICIADALVNCARFHVRYAAPHLAFGGGDLEERVRALLSTHRTIDQPLPWMVCAAALAALVLAVRCAEPAHHFVEALTH